MPAYDSAYRRKAQRRVGRFRGVQVYITAEDLKAVGYLDLDQTVYYRLFPGQRGSFRLQLYRDPN